MWISALRLKSSRSKRDRAKPLPRSTAHWSSTATPIVPVPQDRTSVWYQVRYRRNFLHPRRIPCCLATLTTCVQIGYGGARLVPRPRFGNSAFSASVTLVTRPADIVGSAAIRCSFRGFSPLRRRRRAADTRGSRKYPAVNLWFKVGLPPCCP